MTTEYGSRLKQARKHAGLTQVALSKKTGVPQSTISTAEREGYGSGETPVYARACGVSAIWLGTGEGAMTEQELTPVPAQPMAQQQASFADAVRIIAAHLDAVDEATKRRAMGVLDDLATDTADFERIGRAAMAVIETGKRRYA